MHQHSPPNLSFLKVTKPSSPQDASPSASTFISSSYISAIPETSASNGSDGTIIQLTAGYTTLDHSQSQFSTLLNEENEFGVESLDEKEFGEIHIEGGDSTRHSDSIALSDTPSVNSTHDILLNPTTLAGYTDDEKVMKDMKGFIGKPHTYEMNSEPKNSHVGHVVEGGNLDSLNLQFQLPASIDSSSENNFHEPENLHIKPYHPNTLLFRQPHLEHFTHSNNADTASSTPPEFSSDYQSSSPRSFVSGQYLGEARPFAPNQSQGSSPHIMFESDLVMPTVPVAKQRFPSEKGQKIGFLKIMICGDSSIGKTSLIEAFLHSSEVISLDRLSSQSYEEIGEDEEADGFPEKYASTMLSNSLSNQRSDPSDGDKWKYYGPPLNNLCFVDTAGYGAQLDASSTISSVSNYLTHQFYKTNTLLNPAYSSSSPLLVRLLTNPNGGHTHVDACLYLILHRAKTVDFEYMRAIQDKVNIIPIIVKADGASDAEVIDLKLQVLKELRENGVEFFDFGHTFEELWELCKKSPSDPESILLNGPPFAITIPAQSTFMEILDPTSSEEDSNLCNNSDLSLLKQVLFHTYINQLREATARKFIRWRASQSQSSSMLIPASDYISTFNPTPLTYSTEAYDTDPRIQAIKANEIKRMNLHIARFVSEQKHKMKVEMTKNEYELRRQLATVERQRRMEFLVRELRLCVQSTASDADAAATAFDLTSGVMDDSSPSHSSNVHKQRQQQIITNDITNSAVSKSSQSTKVTRDHRTSSSRRHHHSSSRQSAHLPEPNPLNFRNVMGKVGHGVANLVAACAIVVIFYKVVESI